MLGFEISNSLNPFLMPDNLMRLFLTTLCSIVIVINSVAQTLVPDYKVKTKGLSIPSVITDYQDGIFVYGFLSQVENQSAARLAKLDVAGKLNEDFKKVTADNSIREVIIVNNDNIFVSGDLKQINGTPVRGIAKLFKDGSVDPSFHPAIKVFLIASMPGEQLLVERTDGYYLNKMNWDGSLDNDFTPVFADGQISVSENGTIYILNSQGVVKKYFPNGIPDTSFHQVSPQATPAGFIKCLSSGQILLGGAMTSFDGHPVKGLVMINGLTGFVDPSFSPKVEVVSGHVRAVVERLNRTLVLAGTFLIPDNSTVSLVDLDVTGEIVNTFEYNIYNSAVSGLAESGNGKIILAGEFRDVGHEPRSGIAMFNYGLDAPYALDLDFNPFITHAAYLASQPLVVKSDGAIIYGGLPYVFNGILDKGVVIPEPMGQLDSHGHPDPDFQSPLQEASYISALYGVEEDKFIVTGKLNINGEEKHVVRLNPDGTPDDGFDAHAGPHMLEPFFERYPAIKQRNGLMYLFGRMDGFNGEPNHGLVAVNHDGSVNNSFLSIPAGSQIDFIDVNKDSSIVLSGYFTVDGHQTQLIRIDKTGALDLSLQPTLFASRVNAIAVDSLHNIYVVAGGDDETFQTLDVIKLHPDGTIDNSLKGHGFRFGNAQGINGMQLMPNGNLIVFGAFISYKDEPAPGIVVISPFGERIATPGITLGFSQIYSMTYRDQSYYVTGAMFNPDYTQSFGIAKITLDELPAPFAPTDLTLNAHQNLVHLEWSPSKNANGYLVERSKFNNLSFQVIDTVYSPMAIDHPSETAEYYYRVRATNFSNASGYSNESYVNLNSQPTDLIATYRQVYNVDLSWLGSDFPVTGFMIERSLNHGPFVKIDSVTAVFWIYTDTVDVSGLYEYRVYGFDQNGKSQLSNVAQVQVVIDGLVTPYDFRIVPSETPDAFDAKWVDTSVTETGYYLERSEFKNEGFLVVDSIAADATSLPVKFVETDKKFYYRLTAHEGKRLSGYSSIDSVVWEIRPHDVEIVATLDQQTVTIKLSSGVQHFGGYILEKSEVNDKQFSKIANLSADQHEYTETIEQDIRYYYRATAFNTKGNDTSAVVSVISRSLPKIPANFRASQIAGSRFLFSWDAVFNAKGYLIEYHKQQEGSFSDSISADSTGWHRTLEPNINHYYRISAFNEVGSSVFSEWVVIRWETPPQPATNFQALTLGVDYEVEIRWDHGFENELGFFLERSFEDTLSFEVIDTILHHQEIYRYIDILPGYGTYYYRLAAYNSTHKSAYTETQAVRWVDPLLIPAAPQIVSAERVENLQLKISWQTTTTNEEGFVLEWFVDGEEHQYDTITAGVYSDTIPVPSDQLIYFYVYAFNEFGTRYSILSTIEWQTPPAAPTNLTPHENNDGLELSWTPGSQNEDGFIIDHSTTDENGFVSVDTVGAHVDHVTVPFNESSANFYRVAAFNSTGKVYSEVIKIFLVANRELPEPTSVFPIPADDHLTIRNTSIKKSGMINLLSASGSVVKFRSI
jgi:hypothetical protein